MPRTRSTSSGVSLDDVDALSTENVTVAAGSEGFRGAGGGEAVGLGGEDASLGLGKRFSGTELVLDEGDILVVGRGETGEAGVAGASGWFI
jgi:hypothetical protein